MTGIRKTTLAPAFLVSTCLVASACSPYVYETEISAFREGVDQSVEAYEELVPTYTEWKTEERNEGLFQIFQDDGKRPSTTDACDELRAAYERRFVSQGDSGADVDLGEDLLTEQDYSACHVTPVTSEVPEAGPANLALLGDSLKAYAGGLVAITTAGDEAALQTAFADFNTGAKSLLESLNAKLEEREEQKYDAIANLVYQAGLTYLRQRRFNALKTAVNDSHDVVTKSAMLLSEAAFNLYGPKINEKSEALAAAERPAADLNPASTIDDYVTVWTGIKTASDAYVQAYKDSPAYAFARIAATHAALRESINDPTNQDQLDAAFANAQALKDAAEAALEAVNPDEDDAGG